MFACTHFMHWEEFMSLPQFDLMMWSGHCGVICLGHLSKIMHSSKGGASS